VTEILHPVSHRPYQILLSVVEAEKVGLGEDSEASFELRRLELPEEEVHRLHAVFHLRKEPFRAFADPLKEVLAPRADQLCRG